MAAHDFALRADFRRTPVFRSVDRSWCGRPFYPEGAISLQYSSDSPPADRQSWSNPFNAPQN
jgi:hypothetical protein